MLTIPRKCSAACRILACALLLFPLAIVSSRAAGPSPLHARGYTVIPAPQQVELKGGDFPFGDRWQLLTGAGIKPDDAAIQVLEEEMLARYAINLSTAANGNIHAKGIRLVLAPGTVKIGAATDHDKDKLAEEAYDLSLNTAS